MAIPFLSCEIVSARDNGSAVGLSAYIDRTKAIDYYHGMTYDFARRGSVEEVVCGEVMLPEGARPDYADPSMLWNQAEEAEARGQKSGEMRKNSQIAKHLIGALPDCDSLPDDQKMEMVRRFLNRQFVSRGIPCQWSFHRGKFNPATMRWENAHFHAIVATRRLGPKGFLAKARDLNPNFRFSKKKKKGVVYEGDGWGQLWGQHQDAYYEELGLDLRCDLPGVIPQLHEGVTVTDMTHKGKATRKRAVNDERKTDAKIASLDPTELLGKMVKHRAVFTARELARTAAKEFDGDPVAAGRAKSQVLSHPDLLTLHDPLTGELVGYSAKWVRDQEQSLLDMSDLVARPFDQVGLHARAVALQGRTLDPEQAQAFDYLLSPAGLRIMQGRAGTGKSYTIKAVADAYAADGYTIHALAPQHSVVIDMKSDGFKTARTIQSAIGQLENSSKYKWDDKSVVIVDEAGMVDTETMHNLMMQVQIAGAKLILLGDTAQLASVQRGGSFKDLAERHGFTLLEEVRRQKDDWAKEASKLMGDGRYLNALKMYQEHGSVLWMNGEEAQIQALISAYKNDMAADPTKVRFAYAHSNKDVNRINDEIQKERQETGHVHSSVELECAKGVYSFGVGDRIQLHGTNAQAGLLNGSFGTILSASKESLTVAFDSGSVVTFDPNKFNEFGLGYAGTIYRGQGKTQADVYALYSSGWYANLSYVAMTRHKQNLKLYINQKLSPDIATLTRQMGRRVENSSTLKFQTGEEVANGRSKFIGRVKNGLRSVFGGMAERAAGHVEAGRTATRPDNGQEIVESGEYDSISLDKIGGDCEDVVTGIEERQRRERIGRGIEGIERALTDAERRIEACGGACDRLGKEADRQRSNELLGRRIDSDEQTIRGQGAKLAASTPPPPAAEVKASPPAPTPPALPAQPKAPEAPSALNFKRPDLAQVQRVAEFKPGFFKKSTDPTEEDILLAQGVLKWAAAEAPRGSVLDGCVLSSMRGPRGTTYGLLRTPVGKGVLVEWADELKSLDGKTGLTVNVGTRITVTVPAPVPDAGVQASAPVRGAAPRPTMSKTPGKGGRGGMG